MPGLTMVYFLIFYLGAFQYLRHSNYRDPTSYFFDPSRAYKRLYSIDRMEQAGEFIESVGNLHPRPPVTPQQPPMMCLGIITVKRRQEQYVSRTVGSLLEGLDEGERDSIVGVLRVLSSFQDCLGDPSALFIHRSYLLNSS